MELEGVLRLTLLGPDGLPLQDTVEVTLKHQVLADQRVVRGADASRTIVIKELHQVPQGLYLLRVEPARHCVVSQFVVIAASGETDVQISFRGNDPPRMKSSLHVRVLNYRAEVLRNARVVVRPVFAESVGVTIPFDQRHGDYRAQLMPQVYVVSVQVEGLEPDRRTVTVGEGVTRETFILGEKGMPFYYKQHVKVPFEPRNELLAVAVIPNLSEEQEKSLVALAGQLGLRPEQISEEIRANHVRVFRYLKETGNAERHSVQERLEHHPHVRRAGPLTHLDGRGLSFLTNEFVVRFNRKLTREQALETAAGLKMEVLREIPYIPNGFLLRAAGPVNYDMLEVCSALIERGVVDYAEPNLFVTAVRTYTPNDTRFNEQPHHPIIQSEAAWDTTMGDHDILIAVMDDGCDTGHEDFTNPAGSTWTKVVNQFSFTFYNTSLSNSSHGTRSCGIATALADNAKGVAGVAPGCQLMPLEWPSASLSEWADIYVWISGGDPGRAAPFPSPLAKGADVISNSIAVGDFPLSGVMRDTWDYVTSYGRKGRGCVVVFAAANYNDDIATDNMSRPAYGPAFTTCR